MDKTSGLVCHVEVIVANVHDVTIVPLLLYGVEEIIHGDSGYLGAEKREDTVTYHHQSKKIMYKINRRPSLSKNNTALSKSQLKRREQEKSSIRAKVEYVFGIAKGLFGYRKTLYKGRRKQTAKLHIMFALANLVLADKRFGLAV